MNSNSSKLGGWEESGFQLRMPVCLILLLSRFRPGARDLNSAAKHLAVGFGTTMLLLAVFVQLPQAPYNLQELFSGKSLWLSLPLLSAFLLWSAGAPNLVARVTIICPLLHLLQPLLYLLLALPSWWMLSGAVSHESLIDVFGEPVWGWSGDWELFVRYLALAGPVYLFMFYWNLLFEGSAWISRSFGAGQMLAALLYGLPLLWLSKYVVVDLAATDRLLQLSAQGPSWQVGGVLALVVATVTLTGVLLGWMSVWSQSRRRLIIPGIALAGLVFTWALLSLGLSAEGILLLLGLEQTEEAYLSSLFLRWTLAYVVMVSIIGLAHLIPFRLRGSLMSQQQASRSGNLHRNLHTATEAK